MIRHRKALLGFLLLYFVPAAAPVLGRDPVQADNLPPYEEYLKAKQAREKKAEERKAGTVPDPSPSSSLEAEPAAPLTPEQEEARRKESHNLFMFTDRYGIVHFVQSLDLVPPEYLPQLAEQKMKARAARATAREIDAASINDLAVSTAGLGPEWDRRDEFIVLLPQPRKKGVVEDSGNPWFDLLQEEFFRAEVESWSFCSYLQKDAEGQIASAIAAQFLVFKNGAKAAAYARRLESGMGSGSAGYQFTAFTADFVGEASLVIELREGKDVLRKVLALRRRNAMALLSFAPENMEHAVKLAGLIDDFAKLNMTAD